MVPGETLLSPDCSLLRQKHTISPTFPLQTEDPLENRPIQYQMVAMYDYAAQGPEDLEFSEGDTIDILGEGGSS